MVNSRLITHAEMNSRLFWLTNHLFPEMVGIICSKPFTTIDGKLARVESTSAALVVIKLEDPSALPAVAARAANPRVAGG